MPVFTPGNNFSSGATPPPENQTVSSADKPRFSFPIPLDPIRLLGGILVKWPWIILGMLVFGGLGVIAGLFLNKPSYTVSVSLLKRRVPQTVQVSDSGKAFRPVDLNDATLLATLLATEPLDQAIQRSRNGLSRDVVKPRLNASQLKGTDIFYITYSSPASPADAVNFSSLWAEEINNYTQRLQQAEAREVRQILQKEVASLEKQLAETNQQMLDFSKKYEYLGSESQVSATITNVATLDLQLQNSRIRSSTQNEKLKRLMEQIRRQSPLEIQMKTTNEELAQLRATYTDANSLVQAKLQKIQYLEDEIRKQAEKKDTDIEFYTGTPLGNQLYLDIVTLENDQMETGRQIESLETMFATASARLQEFPGIISGYQALQKQRDSILEGLSFMGNRLKEAEIFASAAPGYWQIFQAPDSRSIVQESMLKKPVVLGMAGSFSGIILAVMLGLLLTQRSSRRSVLECCATTRAPLIAAIPSAPEEELAKALQHLWVTVLSPKFTHSSVILIWNAALDIDEERTFWQALSEIIAQDGMHAVHIQDLTPDALWKGEIIPDTLVWGTESTQLTRRILRAAALPPGPARSTLESVDFWITSVSGNKKSLGLASNYNSITGAYLPPCDGTLAWISPPVGNIRKTADYLSTFLTKRFS